MKPIAVGLVRSATCIALLSVHLMVDARATTPLVRGVDLSALPRVEAGGGRFEVDVVETLAARGIETVRLRVWHSPADGAHGREEVLEMATRVTRAGMGILLDLHYSDSWADPGHQAPPSAWSGVGRDALADSVRIWTRELLDACARREIDVESVQIGNEITNGLLWPVGRVDGSFDRPEQWESLSSLLRAGIAGVEESALDPAIVLHFDRGGDPEGAQDFFDRLGRFRLDYDRIGLSFYPWWHGTLDDLDATITRLAQRTGKEIVVVETAYPWTLGWFDDTHNPVGMPEQLLTGFPASLDGQREFTRDLIQRLRRAPKVVGVFWWEPAWIAAPDFGSPWENLTLFDPQGRPVPALEAFVEE